MKIIINVDLQYILVYKRQCIFWFFVELFFLSVLQGFIEQITLDYCRELDFNYPIDGEHPIIASAALTLKTKVSAITVAVTHDYTIAFIGTQNGHILKVKNIWILEIWCWCQWSGLQSPLLSLKSLMACDFNWNLIWWGL